MYSGNELTVSDTNFTSKNIWVHLVWNYSALTNIYLYPIGLQNNTDFVLLQELPNGMLRNLQ